MTRAYVDVFGQLGNYYRRRYHEGHAEVIGALGAEEANLLHARELARTHRWWILVISAMQGLDFLYEHTGRLSEWSRLANELVPDLVDPTTDGPLPGREEEWSLMTYYRVQIALNTRDWATAERLQQTLVARTRERASAALATPAEALDAEQRNRLRRLAGSVGTLGDLLREQGQPECIGHYQEAKQLSQQVGERLAEAFATAKLGNAYMDIPSLRDLHQAEHCYQRSLELYDEDDRMGRAWCVGQLGRIALERFQKAQDTGAPDEELDHHWDAAAAHHEALDLLPENAVNDLAVTHHQLGNLYEVVGKLDTALTHYQQSIHHEEERGNPYGAGQSRMGVALALANAGRLSDALLYANAALRDFEQAGAGAATEIQQTQQLIAEIEQHLAADQGQHS